MPALRNLRCELVEQKISLLGKRHIVFDVSLPSFIVFYESLLIIFLNVCVEGKVTDPSNHQVFKPDLFISSMLSILPNQL